MMFGGAQQPKTLVKEQLFMVIVEGKKAKWTELKVKGAKPSPRYGHTMKFTKPYVIMFGGCVDSQITNETWCLNIRQKEFSWVKLDCEGEIPSPRLYHTTELGIYGSCAGMIVVFGGRDANKKALDDLWGLRRHRNGVWDWIKPRVNKEKQVIPKCYHHQTVFFGSLMFHVGGVSDKNKANKSLSVFDFQINKWYSVKGPDRFRHVSWIAGDKLMIHGGMTNKSEYPNTQKSMMIDILAAFKHVPELAEKIQSFIDGFTNDVSSLSSRSNSINNSLVPERQVNINFFLDADGDDEGGVDLISEDFTITKEVRVPKKSVFEKIPDQKLCDYFIRNLLRPRTYISSPPDGEFPFLAEDIIQICKEAQDMMGSEPIMVRRDSPLSIFGDIHGQYSDMMRFFDLWGAPCNPEAKKGLVEDNDRGYVFLGDYVDRGNHSLETICLLFALKVKFPLSITLLRGNHDIRTININYGFFDECRQRIKEKLSQPDKVYNRINDVFEYMLLACLIGQSILCVHGGIGATFRSLEQSEAIARPLKVTHNVKTDSDQLVMDILWSDPTKGDNKLGVHPNKKRDPSGKSRMVKFGPDVVKNFLKRNNLSKIVRAHECVMDGFERFAGGDLFTVFSATDYCGKHKNAGAILDVTKHYGLSPKLIYPNMQQVNWIDEDEPGYRPPTPPRWHSDPTFFY